MKFLADIEVEEGLKDSGGDLGSNGQILSSTGSGTNWIAASGTIGGSITDNQIAVGASTANNIEGSNNFSYIPFNVGSETTARLVVEGRLQISDQAGDTDANLYIGVNAGGVSVYGANIGVGLNALNYLTTGERNCAIGNSALRSSTVGDKNIAIGTGSLFYLAGTGRDNNVAIGDEAGQYYSTGTGALTQSSQGVYIGCDTRASANNISNEIVIGYGAVGGGSDTITLGNSSVDLLRIPGLNATSGQVLAYNTTTGGFEAATPSSGGGTIGGTIAATELAVGTTTDTIDGSSKLTFAYVSGGLGYDKLRIGDGSTGSNQVLLDINTLGTGSSRGRLTLSDAGTLRGFLGITGGDEEVTLLSNGNLLLDCNSGDDITMATSSTSGVGIGTTAISKKLQVNGTIYSEQASGEVMIAGNSAYANKYITIREGSNYAARWGLQAEDDIVTSGVMLMSSSKPMAFRSSTNIAFDSVSLSHLIIRASSTNGAANVGIGTDDPQSKLQVDGGIQMGTDTAADNIAAKAGTLRYREVLNIGTPKASNSYIDMYMRTGDSSYEWVNIVTSNW